MSDNDHSALHIKEIVATLTTIRERAMDICWEQWRLLGAQVTSAETLSGEIGSSSKSIIDPEALILVSLALRTYERRLDDILGWGIASGSRLISLQRLNNLATSFPHINQGMIDALGVEARAAGDRRWQVREEPAEEYALEIRRIKKSDRRDLSLGNSAALLPRLRSGFGVGVKADIIAFLLGINGNAVTIQQMADALSYSSVALRTACQEMVLARFIHQPSTRPATFLAQRNQWLCLLDSSENDEKRIYDWLYWKEFFAFALNVVTWAEEGIEQNWSLYLWSSGARDISDTTLNRFLAAAGKKPLAIPDPKQMLDGSYLHLWLASIRKLILEQ